MDRTVIEEYDMLHTGELVLCAVSGGADSVCLLAWLAELAPVYGITLAAAHYNHGLRAAADADEAFVRRLCQRLSVPFYRGGGDIAALAKEDGRSVEEAGRYYRYAFLDQTAAAIHAAAIATAHNQNDNAETVLLNFARGTGRAGLGGIPPVRALPHARLIRPLLNTPRAEIEAYLRQRGLAHVEDASNADTAYARNRVRHKILPQMEQINASAVEHIAQTANRMWSEERYLDSLAQRALGAVRRGAQSAAIDRAALQTAPRPLHARMVMRLFDLADGPKQNLTAAHIDAMTALAETGAEGAQLSLPRGYVAKNEKGRFGIFGAPPQRLVCAVLPPVGQVRSGRWTIACRVCDGAAQERPDRLILCNDAIDCAPCVDTWRGGGAMTVRAQAGSRSLKRLFREANCSPAERADTPVIYVGERPVAALGIGVDADFAPTAGKRSLILDFKTEDGRKTNADD